MPAEQRVCPEVQEVQDARSCSDVQAQDAGCCWLAVQAACQDFRESVGLLIMLDAPVCPECKACCKNGEVDVAHEEQVHEHKGGLEAVDIPDDVIASWAVPQCSSHPHKQASQQH
jgi:hypothetical protein